ncbi:MAG: rhomboid family intramembrane serine protease [Marinicella sp.]
MNAENLKLFGAFLLVNSLVVILYGFAHESITYFSELSQTGVQMISTHFSHHSWRHYLGNMTGLFILLLLFPEKNKVLLLAFLLCIIFVSCYVYLIKIHSFLGTSALLYCVPGCQFVHDLKCNHKQAIMILFTLCLYLYIISPMKTINLDDPWSPMTTAHILGFIAGMVASSYYRLIIKKDCKT